MLASWLRPGGAGFRGAGVACRPGEALTTCSIGWQAPLVQGLLGKVAVLILDSRGRVVEKYVVQLQVRSS